MRYFIGFLVSVGLIVLVFILVLRGFSGGDSKETVTPLGSYANTNVAVRMTVDGPIISEQQHRAYRVTVDSGEVRIDTLRGYQYDTIETKIYPNNEESYMNFLRALDLAGFSKGTEKDANQDERGACATGNRFIMEIIDGSSEIQRYWTAECRGQGTFKGNTAQVYTLFNRQIPQTDFGKLTAGLGL